MWTPYCPKKANFHHDTRCLKDAACPYCGQPNPNSLDSDEVIVIPDSPPARQTLSQAISQPGPGNISRQKAIQETQNKRQEQLHAGSVVHSARPKTTTLTKGNRLMSVKKFFRLIVSIFIGNLENPKLRIYENWRSIRK
jgi:hypothetical protein